MADKAQQDQITEVLDVVEEFITETLDVLDVDPEVEVDLQYSDDTVTASLDGADLGIVIGKRGQTLDAIQYLANAIVIAQCDEPLPVRVDAQGYRERRAVQLEEIAERAAQDASQGRRVRLDPMTSQERKIIHVYLKDHPDVETASEGREPSRRVVVMPRES